MTAGDSSPATSASSIASGRRLRPTASIFVGAARHDSQGQNSGAVYRFSDELEDDPDLGFLQSGKFSPTDLSEGERFGESVSAWEDVLVIGAPYAPRNVIEIDEDTGEEVIVESFPLAGRAEVWVDDGTGYCRVQVLQPEELAANDLPGPRSRSPATCWRSAAPLREGGTGAGIVDAGVVYVYQREASGLYMLLETYEGDVAGHRLGETLAMGMLTEGNESDQMMLMGSPEWRATSEAPSSPSSTSASTTTSSPPSTVG